MSLSGLLRGASGSSSLIAPLGQWFRRVSNIVDGLGPQGQGFLVTTTGPNPVNIPGTAITVPLNSSARITYTVVAESPDGVNVYSVIKTAVFRHPAGGLTQEGPTQESAAAAYGALIATAGFAAVDSGFGISGSTVVVQAIGVAATNIRWRVQVSAAIVPAP
jgi:hypothetical protein